MANEAVIACIKLMLSRPGAVDELASLMMKTPTALTTQGVTIKDVKKAITIISESDYWHSHVLKDGFGSKARRFLFTVIDQDESQDEQDEQHQPADQATDQDDLEVGFSEDEVQASPPPNKTNKKTKTLRSKKKSKQVQSEEEEQPSSPAASSPAPKRRRFLKKSSGRMANSSPSEFGTPNVDEEGEPEENTAEAKEKEKEKPSSSHSSYSFVGGRKENLRPANSSSFSSLPPMPVQTASASAAEPVGDAKPDWSSEFGQVVKQALSWRTDRLPCPFRSLGLSVNSATVAEVKKRWSKLILLLHPDKAPREWRGVKELSDAAQAVNEARAECERRLTATAVSRPGRPEAGQFQVLENNGARVVELRWQPPSNSLVEKFTVLLRYPSVVTLASVAAGADPWLALSEVDPRYRQFFQTGERLLLHIHATNSAGMSDPLIVDVPLRGAAASTSCPSPPPAQDPETEKMFEALRQLARTQAASGASDAAQQQLRTTLQRFTLEQLKSLLRCQGAVRLVAPAPPPSGLGSKAELVERLVHLLSTNR